jgi:hypothetical protein
MTRTPLGLPPVTVDLPIGLAGERNEPVTGQHLNTGINAQDAKALNVQAPEFPEGAQGAHRLAAYFAFAAAAFGFGCSVILTLHGGKISDPLTANVAMALPVLGAAALTVALIISGRAYLKKRRYNRDKAQFYDAVKAIILFQEKLICLPFISGHDHYPVVTAIIKDLELSRNRLMDYAGDGHAPGEDELLAALGALGDYADTEHPTHEQYVAARDTARVFIHLQERTTGQLTSTASKREQAQ